MKITNAKQREYIATYRKKKAKCGWITYARILPPELVEQIKELVNKWKLEHPDIFNRKGE